MMATKTAIITGATSGIGKACAKMLAKNNYNIIITGRRANRLNDLEKEIKNVKVLKLNFDIRDRKETEKQIQNLPKSWKNIDLLINNAGLAAGLSDIQDGDVDKWEQMIDTNIKGLLYISKQIMPIMVANKKGHIVNISSIAGKETYGKGNVYCGTKHAVEAITKGMRIDMLAHGIKVTSIAPGMVNTEFSEVRLGNKKDADKVYEGFTPLYAKDIAETVEFVITRSAHVNINEMLVMPTAQATATNTFKQ